jgi:hypothetical protein
MQLDDLGGPIPEPWGVGSWVASTSGTSWWAGGAALGPIRCRVPRRGRGRGARPHPVV